MLLDRPNPLELERTRPGPCRYSKKRFGHMRIVDFKPKHAYQYVVKRISKKTGAPAVTAAHRELEVLSHAFTWAVMWGDIDAHPIEEELRFEGDLAPEL